MEIKKELTLFDSICIIVGIIIGAGIYETAPLVARSMGSMNRTLLIWLTGGGLALIGAFCYAELASAYPHEGGDYVYLTRAYGRGTGHLFGWVQLAIIRPADIALLAFVFARYALTFYNPFKGSRILYASLAVAALTLINILGVKAGKWTQNLLTVLKGAGLIFIVIVGLMFAPGAAPAAEESPLTLGGLELALILVLFTFGGWNEMAYVAAEVKKPGKNIARALLLGTVVVTLLYVLINAAFLKMLGYERMINSRAVAADTVASVLPHTAGRIISILICLSALGAINGLIFTGARISYALGSEHVTFRGLGIWHPRFQTPVRALAVQGLISFGIVLMAGSFIDTIFYTAPVVWLFFLATAVSVVVLRRKEPDIPRPYRVPLYPLPVILFSLCAGFMFYSSLTYAVKQKPVGLILICSIILLGILVFLAGKKRMKRG